MRAVIVRNPAAGKAIKLAAQFDQAVGEFRRAGWDVDIKDSTKRGHAADLTRAAVTANTDAVIAAGGDGTINEVIQALAGTSVLFGCLPMGTVNLWGHEIGLSSDVVKAARQLVSGNQIGVDLGKAGNAYFLLMAGIGFDAEVVTALGEAEQSKQRFGRLPYVAPAIRVWPRFHGAEVHLQINGSVTTYHALMVLASNTRWYGGLARPARDAIANDGRLDLTIYSGRGPLGVLRHLAPFVIGRQRGMRSSETLRVEAVTVTADPPLAVQVDGDYIGNTPVDIAVRRHALQAIVPVTYDRSLLRSSSE